MTSGKYLKSKLLQIDICQIQGEHAMWQKSFLFIRED